MNSITISLPLPPKSLSPNARCHWAVKARDTRKCREAARWWTFAALKGDCPHWRRSTFRATFYHTTNRRRDDDNLIASLKPYRDGIADSGLLDDDVGVVTLPPLKCIDRENPRVEITITQLEDSPCEPERGL